jgi:hypothetical protein
VQSELFKVFQLLAILSLESSVTSLSPFRWEVSRPFVFTREGSYGAIILSHLLLCFAGRIVSVAEMFLARLLS